MPEKMLLPHTVNIENRKNMSVSGVTQVVAYDEFHIVLKTDYGQMIIQGKNLVAGEMSSARSTIKLTGNIELIQYKAVKDKSESLLSKLLK